MFNFGREGPDISLPDARRLWGIILIGAIGGLLSGIATPLGEYFLKCIKECSPSEPSEIALEFAFGVVPGFFIGVTIDFARLLIREINRLARLRAKLEIVTTHLNDKTEFNNYRESLLNCDPHYTALMRELVHESTIKNIRHVPHVLYEEFYWRLVRAIGLCSTWEGIHQREPRLLGLVADERDDGGHLTSRAKSARAYFEALKEHSKRAGTKRLRIIILKDDDRRQFLEDKDGMYSAFWKWNGGAVENFLIREKAAKDLAWPTIIDELDDCALHDQQFFLHYERDKQTLLFDYGGDGTAFAEDIARAVERLFHALEHRNGDFSRLGPNGLTDGE